MEIGHNVMHGQYDWMSDPRLSRQRPSSGTTPVRRDQWRHSHNYIHHTFTNIVGKDRDIGYGVLRMTEDEPWHPLLAGQPAVRVALALFFQYGVALHDLEIGDARAARQSAAERRACSGGIWRKVRGQTLKDYVLFPLLSGPRRRSCWPATRPPTWRATSGRSRSSSAGTSPRGR